jgi:single-stranded DNA-binding protein
MYLNNVTLTGFLGGDADTRTTKNDTNFTAFLAGDQELLEGSRDRRMDFAN